MKRIALLLALCVAAPLSAMGTPPKVDAGTQPVSAAEVKTLQAVHACARKAYDALPAEQRLAKGVQVDYISTSTAAAITAQKLNNRTAFDHHRTEVLKTVVELAFAC